MLDNYLPSFGFGLGFHAALGGSWVERYRLGIGPWIRVDETTLETFKLDKFLLHRRIGSRMKGLGSSKEVPMTDVITRHVKQVADFNKALEKRKLWREREKELKAKHSDTWGILQSEDRRPGRSERSVVVSSSAKRVLDSLDAGDVDKEVVERVKEKVARKFGSFDAHAAMRQKIAKEKEERQLQLQNVASDAWVPDRFYTEELKQQTPWLNPLEFLSELQPTAKEGSLTPVASDSDSESPKKRKKLKKKKDRKKHKKHKKRKKE
ncbi:protein FAM133B [Cyclospora cayetanensis]|uniref:Protein FAM133B n=1 Tax=Cyclospora cayetanensis TaxID=88456 RepID=A0A6P6RXX0_9EIME|nr:protein FAM133B [Cyclospora cayetanensis]